MLLIVTFRPEFDPPWIGRSYVTALTINRLGEREIGAMIDRVVGNKPLPASIRQDIIERTDGIPLFVEEMTKAVLEAEGEGAAEQRGSAVPSSALRVSRKPARFANGAARPARLGQGGGADRSCNRARVLACTVTAVVRKPEGGLNRHLTVSFRPACCSGRVSRPMRPICSNMPWCRMRPTARCCASRDARFMPASPKPLKSQFAEIAENQPELLARHCTEAGLIEKAANLWGKAGQRSLERSALSKLPNNSRAPLPRSRLYPRRQPCVAKRSRFRSRS